MDETTDVVPESSTEEVVETEIIEETPAPEVTEEKPKAERTVPYSRFKSVNDELAQLKKNPPVKNALDVEDYIDISASLDGLDQREKSYLAQQHKLTGQPLTEIRNSEDFQFWQTAYRSKVEKEKSLKPTGTQPDSERQRSASEQITSATTLAEQEELLKKYGLYKDNRPRSDRRTIG